MDDPVSVHQTYSVAEAQLLAGMLEANGFQAVASSPRAGTVQLVSDVLVPASQAEDARDLLALLKEGAE